MATYSAVITSAEGIIAGGQIFKIATSRFVNVSEEEMNLMKENAIPRNTNHTTKLGMTLFKGKMWKVPMKSLLMSTCMNKSMVSQLITCRAKLLNADWLRQRAFFLNQEGTFGNQEGMITWCWLAEHACIKLVSRFKRSLKGISETHRFWVWS